MLIEASKLIHLPIGALDSQAKIGSVQNIIIDPKNGELLGFFVKESGLFSPTKVLSSTDITEFDANGLVTKTNDNFVDLKEIIKIKDVVKKNIKIIGASAITESGSKVGKVFDLLINTDTLLVVKYYIKGFFQDKIISSGQIIKINKHGVIVSDDTLEKVTIAEPENAAV
jgi:uncharacterized protein YrrD